MLRACSPQSFVVAFPRAFARGLRLRRIYNVLPTIMPVFPRHGLRLLAPCRGIDWQVGRFAGVFSGLQALCNCCPRCEPWGQVTIQECPVPTGSRPWTETVCPFRGRWASQLLVVSGLQALCNRSLHPHGCGETVIAFIAPARGSHLQPTGVSRGG